jgi:hypothetical protein
MVIAEAEIVDRFQMKSVIVFVKIRNQIHFLWRTPQTRSRWAIVGNIVPGVLTR